MKFLKCLKKSASFHLFYFIDFFQFGKVFFGRCLDKKKIYKTCLRLPSAWAQCQVITRSLIFLQVELVLRCCYPSTGLQDGQKVTNGFVPHVNKIHVTLMFPYVM